MAGIGFLLQAMALGNNVRFAWSPNSEPGIAGYRVHYGVVTRNYTQIHDAGNTNGATVSNLVAGTTYYFALTAYNTLGLQSDYSTELSFRAPTNTVPPLVLRLAVTPSKHTILTVTGQTNRNYSIEATTNLATWTSLGTVAIGASGSGAFTDTNAPAHQKRFYRARAL